MSKISLFSQILMVIVAVVIGIMYIKPTVAVIRTTQDATNVYAAEAAKVLDVNLALEQKVALVEAVQPGDVAALNRFMPDTVDEIAVMKDITNIFESLSLPLTKLTFAGSSDLAVASETETMSPLRTYEFKVATKVSYQSLKKLLTTLEVNNYILQVDSLVVAPDEDGDLTVDMALSAFSRTIITPSASNIVNE